MNMKFPWRFFSLLFLLLTLAVPAAATPAPVLQADRIVVEKSARRLLLLAEGRVIRRYPIALGRRPRGPKKEQGDLRTPEGTYVIDYRNPQSRFHRALHISYPSAADLARARRLGVPAGGDIMIHGLPDDLAMIGEAHRISNWTRGCIAVTNREIEEIWRLVPDGTIVEIRP